MRREVKWDVAHHRIWALRMLLVESYPRGLRDVAEAPRPVLRRQANPRERRIQVLQRVAAVAPLPASRLALPLRLDAASLEVHVLEAVPVVRWLVGFFGGNELVRSYFSPLLAYESNKKTARVKLATIPNLTCHRNRKDLKNKASKKEARAHLGVTA
ncbi:hypothetical protein JH272_16820 [Xanthomonas campestris pv. campestris]|nr:hypothetical protein JH272_16820 [Xanthomonas campestris pv. campestris]